MCYKKKAIELMFCSEVKMNASPEDVTKTTYNGLNAAMQHWWSSPEWKAKFNGLKNTRRIAESKKIIEDQLTHLKGYQSIGIDVKCAGGHMVELPIIIRPQPVIEGADTVNTLVNDASTIVNGAGATGGATGGAIV
jgi:hypothetical protein